jgi:ferredoxin
MKVVVDKETCTGCGLCEDTCPQVFKINDNIAEVIAAKVPPDAMDCALQAAEECPVEAIIIEQ